MALQLGAARVGRARRVSASSAAISALEPVRLASGTTTVRPPRPASSQPGVARCAAPPQERLVAEAHDRAVEVLAALEDVHLAAADDA